jgi:hypothetical protein
MELAHRGSGVGRNPVAEFADAPAPDFAALHPGDAPEADRLRHLVDR